MSQRDVYDVEISEGFDRSIAIETLDKFFFERIGGPMGSLESISPGVIAIEQVSPYDYDKFSWDELAATLVRATGIGVVCIADADWEQTDDCDVEATWIAFDIPSTPENYRDDVYRNKIDEAMLLENIPSEEEFRARDEAMRFVYGYIMEMRGKLRYAEGAEKEWVEKHLEFSRSLHKNGINAKDDQLITLLMNRDVDGAIDLEEKRKSPSSSLNL